MPVMRNAIVFDLDGTIALIEHRLHHIDGKKKDWHAFFAACTKDLPNAPIIEVLRALHQRGHEIWIASGRSDEVREETVQWLAQHDIPFDHLVMRRAGDRRADDIVKREWLVNGPLPRERIMMVFDDRDKVVAMWRRHGLTCLQVAPGDF